MNKKVYSVERGFISKLLETKDMQLLKELQIKSSFFTGENKKVYLFIQDTFRNTGDVPTERVIKNKFPSFKLETHYINDREVVGTDENLNYWCQELRNKAKHNKLAEVTEEVAEKLDKGDTEEAYALAQKGIWSIEEDIVQKDAKDITKDTEDRKEAYLKKKELKGMMGIPTGIPHLDNLLHGLVKETLTTVIARTGVGKAVTLDTPILTPNGFVPMRDIKVDSIVYDEKGNSCKVLKVFPQGKKQVYRVHFEDETFVDCCKDHLWKFKTVDDLSRNNSWRVETTEQLLKRGVRRGKSYKLCVPVNEPIDFAYKDLPLDPYVLGCLLGDGGFTTDRISFTNPEKDIVEELNERLKEWGYFKYNKATNCQYLFKSNNPRENKLYRTITKIGLGKKHSHYKFIPLDYLHSSRLQRLELLQGLIDTDGNVNDGGHVSFSTSSKQLYEDIQYLIRSLGYRCRAHSYEEDKSTEYRVTIVSDSNVFFTSEKHNKKYAERDIPNRKNFYDILKITDIEVLDKYEEMQCITVDSPYSTFICGDFIVTHNTWLLVLVGAYAMLHNYKVVCFITEMSTDLMQDRFEAMLFGMLYGDFNYSKFKSGNLDKEQEEQYFEFLEEDLPKLEPLVLENVFGVSSIVSTIEREKPDLVLVDGAYLMEDEQGAKDDWLRVTHITRDLKKIAKKWHIPIVINSQADKKTSKKTGPSLNDISYAQSIGMDSDNILSLFRDEVMIQDNEMMIKILKQREGVLGKVFINWNFTNMNFESIYSETESKTESEEEDYDEESKVIEEDE